MVLARNFLRGRKRSEIHQYFDWQGSGQATASISSYSRIENFD
jgi:hypothetical protein